MKIKQTEMAMIAKQSHSSSEWVERPGNKQRPWTGESQGWVFWRSSLGWGPDFGWRGTRKFGRRAGVEEGRG
jgi:hypothetical protein